MSGFSEFSRKMGMLVILLTIIATSPQATATTLNCNFSIGQWLYLPEPEYIAFVTNPEIFDIIPVTVDKIEGGHLLGYHNSDVRGIDIHNATEMVVFPRNLDKFFKNLVLIGIFDSKLAEVSQSDLMVFPLLRHLYLSHNRIRVIRHDLFKFNPRLEVILLYKNQLLHIDPRTFSELTRLKLLYLGHNICPLGNARSRSEVAILLAKVESGNCTREEFMTAVSENPLRVELGELKQVNQLLLIEASQRNKEIDALTLTVQKLNDRVAEVMTENQKLISKVNEMSRMSAKVANFTEILREKDGEINSLKVKLNKQVNENRNLTNEMNVLMANNRGG